MAAKSKHAKRPVRKKAPPRADNAFPLEVDPKRIEETFAKLKGELVHWANKSRYTRVRLKFRGKQLLPDLHLAAVMAAEGLTFYWGGILRALIFNIAGKTVFDVELINDSEKRVQLGKEALLTGDLDKALEHFRAAIAMERDNAQAHLNVGVALKLKGDPEGARLSLEKAKSLDPDGPLAAEADKVLMQMKPPGTEPAPLMRIR
jgi:tetratricopeptide (TPR) repeat protein